jgi:BclB C-terminal domain-containing protein
VPGIEGAPGAPGAPGIPGTPGNGAIIPFASGTPVVMTTTVGGLFNTVSTVSFGNSITGVPLLGGGAIIQNFANAAFMMPRDGTITGVSGYFSSTVGLALVGSTVTVSAQVYCSTTLDNSFVAVSGALVVLSPPMTGVLAVGSISKGTTTGLSIPVTAGTLCLMVFKSDVTAGIDIATVVTGIASGGLAIQ